MKIMQRDTCMEMIKLYKEYIKVFSKKDVEMINITQQVKDIVSRSGCKDGIAFIVSNHTTTGITVNEPLPDVEKDIINRMSKLVPENGQYVHARFLPSYGATSNNSQGHLKGSILGNHAIFSVTDKMLDKGSAQDIYLVECDGPQTREVLVKIVGS